MKTRHQNDRNSTYYDDNDVSRDNERSSLFFNRLD